jgi:kynureninase
MMEAQAFPSDRYAVESQLSFHGYNPAESLVLLSPREGEHTVRLADIEAALAEHGQQTALVMIGGVNYYTGQMFDMERITQLAHQQGCMVGFDLAHAIGNVPLRLHDWGPDFCAWCSYKYLNSGPGSVAGCFVHERHANNPALPRFAGWWGQQKATRFDMRPEFDLIEGAEGWQLSNPPVLSMAAVKASLDIFEEVGMEALHVKAVRLTGYLEFLLDDLRIADLEIITPRDPAQRGCQLSVTLGRGARQIFEQLIARRIICDWRGPECMRITPVPLYNTYMDVWRFAQAFGGLCAARCK